jgi:hypothetical protein
MYRILCAIVRWTARVGALLLAGSFGAFVLGEPHGPFDIITPREWVAMALLFGAVAAMLVAWKWEFFGALISLFALGAFAAVTRIQSYAVLSIAAIPNLLFLLDWKMRHTHSAPIPKTG